MTSGIAGLNGPCRFWGVQPKKGCGGPAWWQQQQQQSRLDSPMPSQLCGALPKKNQKNGNKISPQCKNDTAQFKTLHSSNKILTSTKREVKQSHCCGNYQDWNPLSHTSCSQRDHITNNENRLFSKYTPTRVFLHNISANINGTFLTCGFIGKILAPGIPDQWQP